jgi:Zn-dependent peptidase ImmA (M78 family)
MSSNRDPLEKQANAFASEFLMPLQDVQEAIQLFGGRLREPGVLGLVAQQFNVSLDAMFYRFAKLGFFRWDERVKYIKPWQQSSEPLGARVNHPGHEVARGFLNAAVGLYENKLIDTDTLAEWFFAPVARVKDYLADLRQQGETGIGPDD